MQACARLYASRTLLDALLPSPCGHSAYESSFIFKRLSHNYCTGSLMKKVQLSNSDLQVSIACIGTMVRAVEHADLCTQLRTAGSEA